MRLPRKYSTANFPLYANTTVPWPSESQARGHESQDTVEDIFHLAPTGVGDFRLSIVDEFLWVRRDVSLSSFFFLPSLFLFYSFPLFRTLDCLKSNSRVANRRLNSERNCEGANAARSCSRCCAEVLAFRR